jgi:carbon-monoxide dehydrogenase medium subunit
MPRVAATLSYRAIRTRGTIGGSLALAGPAADWPVVFAALDAEVTLFGPSGRRALQCSEFATGPYETQLDQEEIVETVRIPKLLAEARSGYVKLIRPSASFAEALAVAIVDRGRGLARVVLGAANGAPVVLHEVSRVIAENGREAIRDAIAADLDHAADRHFDEFQRNLLSVAAMRAVQQALQ